MENRSQTQFFYVQIRQKPPPEIYTCSAWLIFSYTMSVQGWETGLHPVFIWEVGFHPITLDSTWCSWSQALKWPWGGSLISGLHLGFLHGFLAVMVKLQACHVWLSSLSPHVVAAKCEAFDIVGKRSGTVGFFQRIKSGRCIKRYQRGQQVSGKY